MDVLYNIQSVAAQERFREREGVSVCVCGGVCVGGRGGGDGGGGAKIRGFHRGKLNSDNLF